MENILEIDKILFTLINTGCSNSFLDSFLVPFRHKLFWIPLYLFIITFLFVNFKNKLRFILLGFLMLLIISDTVSSRLIKKTIKRTRPCNTEELAVINRVHCGAGYSFTSSHATNHFALASYLFLLFGFSKYRFLFYVWASLIAFAQVYVGVHYPLDVICGALIGIIIGYLVYLCYLKITSFKLTV